MNRAHLRLLLAAVGTVITLVACTAGETTSPTPTAIASDSASASREPTAQPSTPATEEPSPSPTARSTPTEALPEASAEPTATSLPSDFAVVPNADADALFAVRDHCRNPQDGYEVELPDDWYTNTEIRDVPACSWFSPAFFTVDDFDVVPDEIAIEIFWIPGERAAPTEALSSEDGLAGGQYATRSELTGTSADPRAGRSYEYVIQLGPTPEAGPNLVARTDTDMGGDYGLNKAVLDRIIATIEFLGSVQ